MRGEPNPGQWAALGQDDLMGEHGIRSGFLSRSIRPFSAKKKFEFLVRGLKLGRGSNDARIWRTLLSVSRRVFCCVEAIFGWRGRDNIDVVSGP